MTMVSLNLCKLFWVKLFTE